MAEQSDFDIISQPFKDASSQSSMIKAGAAAIAEIMKMGTQRNDISPEVQAAAITAIGNMVGSYVTGISAPRLAIPEKFDLRIDPNSQIF